MTGIFEKAILNYFNRMMVAANSKKSRKNRKKYKIK